VSLPAVVCSNEDSDVTCGVASAVYCFTVFGWLHVSYSVVVTVPSEYRVPMTRPCGSYAVAEAMKPSDWKTRLPSRS
jgi:hypothetical protein